MSQFLRKAVVIISANVVAAVVAFSQTPSAVNTASEVNRSQAAPIAGQPANASTTSAVAQPAYLTPIGGFQGVLAETVEGSTIAAQSADDRFNPASAVKLATALVALQAFGPEHQFMTGLWSTGTIDKSTGTLNGDLVVTGRDPSFHYEHAVMLARQLNELGIRKVTGNLIIAPAFTMNFAWSAQRSGEDFLDTLDSARRSASATRAWLDDRTLLGDSASLSSVPSVVISGDVLVGSAPAGAVALLTHKSSRLVDVLKALLCYSNNFMAERIGEMIGGPTGVGSTVTKRLGISPDEVALSSTSGLGVNRVTPRAMMKILRGLRDELAKNKLTLSDILPVAGVDPGTLEDRYTDPLERGSVIAKTGTLVRTDGGASSLVGQMKTKSGRVILFVIMNQRGSVVRFRQNQDEIVAAIQNSLGGPAAFDYHPGTLLMRLANSHYATAKASGEYEPRN
ncbi:MAG TPA: D-alanyl-D-alanine carboxypeptidase [Pyrinomonadaceae bacterium]|nr:D-alanyl-D-alanine carboxypeptidase [Pyrinomonadaceae bacterium]